MARFASSGLRTSLLTVPGAAGVESVGLRPVGEVMGCIVEHIGFAGWQGCGYYGFGGGGFGGLGGGALGGGIPGTFGGGIAGGVSRTVTSSGGRYSGFAPYVDALYRGYQTALARMEAEAKGLEAEQARMAAEARARDAEAKAREAEQARTEAEQARVQAEQARMQAEAEIKARSAEQAKTAALTKELSDLRAQQTDRGLVLTVGDVLFATGKAEVAAGGLRSIDKLAEFLKKNPTRNLLIEGHTDNTGPEDFNLKLSQQRADAVRDALVSRGVGADRITTKGYGPKYPVVANDTAAGRQQNRRVEVVVLNEGATAESGAR